LKKTAKGKERKKEGKMRATARYKTVVIGNAPFSVKNFRAEAKAQNLSYPMFELLGL